MRKLSLILVLLLVIPIVFAYSCNIACLKRGYAFGKCIDKCGDYVEVSEGENCLKKGSATLVIGTDSIGAYEDGDAYIDEDRNDPDWVWIISGLSTEDRTTVSNTDDDTQHSGPILGIKNRFLASNIDEEDIKAKGLGEGYCMPQSYVCVKFNDTNVDDYATYTISKTTTDLTDWNTSWSAKDAILIYSLDSDTGLKTQKDNYDIASLTTDVRTDKIWVIFNNTGSYAAIFYEKTDASKGIAGYVLVDGTDDFNIADVEYYNTKDDNIQIDLRGDFGTANNLNLVLDILGDEGAAATNGNDDITINLMHGADDDFDGFGETAGSAEDADLVWVNTNIGKKDEDHRTLYGIVIENPEDNCDSDRVELEIPEDQVMAGVLLTGESIVEETKITENWTISEEPPETIFGSEIVDKENYNLILIGGPCANPFVENFSEFPTCEDWELKRGESMIKIIENGDKTAMLVAGTTGYDTEVAVGILNDYESYNLKGTYIKIVNEKIVPILTETKYIDLSDYPYPYVKHETFQHVLLVIGEKSSASDGGVAIELSSNLLEKTRKKIQVYNETEISTFKETTSYDIPLGTAIAGSKYFSASLTDDTIGILQDDRLNFDGDDYNFHDEITLYQNGPTLETSLSSTDDVYDSNIYMELLQGRLRYYYVFDEKIDLTKISADNPLTIKFMNDYLSITEVDSTKFVSQIAKEYVMNTGDVITVDNVDVKLIGVDLGGSIIVEVNNTKDIINEGISERMAGLEIKNIVGIAEPGIKCCCYDLFSSLR